MASPSSSLSSPSHGAGATSGHVACGISSTLSAVSASSSSAGPLASQPASTLVPDTAALESESAASCEKAKRAFTRTVIASAAKNATNNRVDFMEQKTTTGSVEGQSEISSALA